MLFNIVINIQSLVNRIFNQEPGTENVNVTVASPFGNLTVVACQPPGVKAPRA